MIWLVNVKVQVQTTVHGLLNQSLVTGCLSEFDEVTVGSLLRANFIHGNQIRTQIVNHVKLD